MRTRKKITLSKPTILVNEETPPQEPKSKEWIESRIAWLKYKTKIVEQRLELADGEKKEILEDRLKNIKEEIKQRSEELKNK